MKRVDEPEERTVLCEPWDRCPEDLRAGEVLCERCGIRCGIAPTTIALQASGVRCYFVCIPCGIPLIKDAGAKLHLLPGQVEEARKAGIPVDGPEDIRVLWELLKRGLIDYP